MTTRQRYDRSPIVEAIIDIQFTTPDGLELSRVPEVVQPVRDRYPTETTLNTLHGHFNVGNNFGVTTRQEQVGYQYTSNDGHHVFRLGLKGFSLSRLQPYTEWEEFRDEARCIWDAVTPPLSIKSIRRIAVRYLNRINLPLPLMSFHDYLRTAPDISPDLPQELTGFVYHLEIPLHETHAMLLLNQALVDSESPDVASVVLDLDIYRTAEPGDDSDIWEVLESLHIQADHVFEACITDKTRELIK